MNGWFDPETPQLVDETEEVRIWTRRAGGSSAHRAAIRAATVGGRVFVRSRRGPRGRRYTELSVDPAAAPHVGGHSLPVHAAPVADERTTGSVNEAYRKKHPKTLPGPAQTMLRPETLPTALRLCPA